MSPSERPLQFACSQETLLGVLSLPEAAKETGVVIVVGGPQYRAGSHRQFVLLARAVAARGFAVLRFDVRGMGDSTGAQRSFEDIDDDIAAAIDALVAAVPAVKQVALWGLCDGASAALLSLTRLANSSRVAALCLLNPWVRSPHTQARAQVKHYYADRLRQRDFWLKLLRGGVARRAASDLWRNLRAMLEQARPASQAEADPFQLRMAEQWRAFGGQILLILSGDDYTAKEFLEATLSDPAWNGALEKQGLMRLDFPEADHTFSGSRQRLAMEDAFISWLTALGSPGRSECRGVTGSAHRETAHAP